MMFLVIFIVNILQFGQALKLVNNPKITNFPKEVGGLPNDHVILVCKANGTPSPSFNFLLNKVKVDNENSDINIGPIIRKVSNDTATFRLRLNPELNGSVVECVASNVFGSETDRTTISVYDSNKAISKEFPQIFFDTSPVLDQTGSNIEINCEIQSDSLETDIFWLKNTSYIVDMKNPRYHQVGKSTLKIMNLQPEDDGFYECVAYNSHGMRISPPKNIAQSRVNLPPVIEKLPSTIYVTKNSGTVLRCRATGYPEPLVWWTVKKDSGERQLGVEEVRVKDLSLQQIDNSRTYLCNAKNELGKVFSEVLVKVKQPPGAPRKLDTLLINGTSVLVQWESSDLSLEDSFTITVKPSKKSSTGILNEQQYPGVLKNKPKSGLLSFNVTGLQPFTKYLLWIYAISNEEGPSESSETLIFTTAETKPENAPQIITAYGFGVNSVNISWYPPTKPNGIIKGYKIFHSKFENDPLDNWSVTRSKIENHIFHDLQKDSFYFIKISAYNNAGDGPLSETFPINVNSGVPSRPQNFKASALNESSLLLTWSKSHVSKDANILDYELIYIDNVGNEKYHKIINSTFEEYTLTNLKAGTIYTLSLAGRSQNGKGIASQISQKTKNLVPKAPVGDIIQSVNSSAIMIKFQTTANLQDNPKDYLISVINPEQKSEARQYRLNLTEITSVPITHTVVGLKPNSPYKISVAAINEMGRGDFYNFHPTKTKSEFPLVPINVKAKVIEPRTNHLPSGEIVKYIAVEVVWDHPPGAPRDLPYELKFIPLDIKDEAGFNLQTKTIRLSNENSYVTTEKDNLQYGITYRISLSVITSSNSMAPTEIDITMPISKPSGPPTNVSLTALNSTTALLSWEPPALQQRNGEIRGYLIRYGIAGSSYFSSNYPDRASKSERNVNISDPNIRSYEAKNLDPRNNYNFQVLAYNDAGQGPFSMIIGMRLNSEAPLPPEDIKVKWINSQQIKVTWNSSEISKNNISIHGYRIEYKENGNLANGGTAETLDLPPNRMTILSNLNSINSYTIRIKSRGSDGQFGVWSDSKFIGADTKISTDKSVRNVVCNCELEILETSWFPPKMVKGLKEYKLHFKGLQIYYDNSGILVTNSTAGIEKFMPYEKNHDSYKFTMTKLEPNTEYSLNITSVYFDGSEGMPLETSCITKTSRPESVPFPEPTAFEREKLQVVLNLYRVSERFGKIRNYFLIVSPRNLVNSSQPNNIQRLLEEARDKPSSRTMYVVAQFSQSFFPPKKSVKQFLLGDPMLMYTDSMKLRKRRDLVNMKEMDKFTLYEEESSLIIHDNKKLITDTMYKACLMACIIDENNEQKCTTSNWSPAFFPDRDQLIYDSPIRKVPSVFSWLINNKYFTLAIVIACIGIALLLVCLIFIGCFLRRRMSTQLKLNDALNSKPRNGDLTNGNLNSGIDTAKQPLMLTTSSFINGNKTICGPISTASSPFGTSNGFQDVSTLQRSNGILNTSFIGPNGVNSLSKSALIKNPELQGYSSHTMQHNSFDMYDEKYTISNQKLAPKSSTICKAKGLDLKESSSLIPIGHLKEYVQKLFQDQYYLISQEYANIDPPHQFTWDNSNLEVNKMKNRYANVVAYDHSRVVLQPIEGILGSDYINANYIDGYDKPNFYIATQGPTSETRSDFWRMIWEQNVHIIVMMTRLEERSRIKCDQYWPIRGSETFANGMLTVTPVETKEFAYYTVRKFNLCAANDCITRVREIEHIQFTHWPDHGTPDYPIPLLLFLKRVRASYNHLRMINYQKKTQYSHMDTPMGPIVVHCSAGVGRTGTFIVVDIMLEQIKNEKTIDVYQCVSRIRSQRNFMVQTEDQYIFIYTTLIEAIDSGNTEVPVRSLMNHYKNITQIDPMTNISGLELEWNKTMQYRVTNARFNAAIQRVNEIKNNLPTLLPYDSSRVHLSLIRGLEGSDYINASHIDGYLNRRMYIATQSPNNHTIEDFWRMIWEQNSNILVNLTNQGEVGRYWPSDKPSRYQFYIIEPKVEYNMQNYTLREFKINDTRDGQSRTVRQFQFTDWIETGPNSQIPQSSENFIEFLNQIHKTKDQFGQDGPITVHCDHGFGRTGLFLALSVILERMRFEGVVDTFLTIRHLRTQRPGLVQSLEQYQFCYSAALEYISSYEGYSL